MEGPSNPPTTPLQAGAGTLHPGSTEPGDPSQRPGGSSRTRAGATGAAAAYPESVNRLIDELAGLPGIGRRSAERLAFHILKAPKAEALDLAQAIADVKGRVRHCRVCYNLADEPFAPSSSPPPPAAARGGSAEVTLCSICADERRDRATVMVVEQPKDLISLEQTGMFRGIYHVLMGRISPLDNIGPGDLTVRDLLARIDDPARNAGGVPLREVVLALNPTLEGDGTALYLADTLGKRGVQVTRLARGLPTGVALEYASKAVLADAIEGRKPM